MDPARNFLERVKDNDRELEIMGETFLLETSTSDHLDRNPIIDNYTSNEVKAFTNFTKEEVLDLFGHVSDEFAQLVTSKGPRFKLTSVDSFFLLLTYLKTYPTYSTLGKAFRISSATVQKHIEKMITNLSTKLAKEFIKFVRKEEQERQGIRLPDFPNVAILLDCTVQEVPRYGRNFTDSKVFYSEKHKIYCVKKEIAHLPDGRACFVSPFHVGSKHDFSVFLEDITIYKKNLKKESNETEFWSIMADKGYEGANSHIPAILPKKGTNISQQEKRENKRIGSSRVIVENFYGRLKQLWGASRLKVKTDLKLYNNMLDICVALTNYQLIKNPLRASDANVLRNLSNPASRASRTNSANTSTLTEGSTGTSLSQNTLID